MVDVRLLHPKEKLEAAARLAEAIEAAGYTVERQAIADTGAFPALPAKGADPEVLLLIWSRGLVTAAMNGGLAEARRHPNLIEASVDGIEPGVGGEASPVVLLSGWRGQPFHHGWQRILADIKRLSGPREAASKPATAAQPESDGRGPPGPARRSGTHRTGVRAAVAAGALLVASLGAATALDWGGTEAGADARAGSPTAPAESLPATAVPGPPPGEPAMMVQADERATASYASPAAASEPSALAPTVAPASVSDARPAAASDASPAARKPEAGRAEPRRKAAAQSVGAKRLARASEPAVKRYSRKYSKTMRLFCQRSGRSTPQCRTFARSMRDQRG
jgi:hypothetical protein